MTMRKSLIAAVMGAVLSVFLACCHLLDTLYNTANSRLPQDAELYAEPGVVSALSSPILLPVALILFAVIIFSCGATCSDYPTYHIGHPSPGAGVIGILSAGSIGYTAVTGLLEYSKKAGEPAVEVGADAVEKAASLPPILWQICMGLGVGAALAIAVISIGFFSGKNMLENTPLLMMMPVLWLGMRLVLTFLDMTSNASISERSVEVVMLIFMTLFVLSLGKYLANVGGSSSRWANVYGGLTVMFAFTAAISRLVLSITGSKAHDGALAQTCADITDSYGLAVNYGDLAMGIFAMAMLFYISSEKYQEEEEMAFGRKRRASGGREQDPYRQNQAPQGMYQQQNAMQQNMYQQQRQMQQNMYQQRQMQQAMYQQQRQMQQNMYQQQMQPNPYQQNMMPQPAANEQAIFGNNSTLPTDGISRQAAAQQRSRQDRRGMPRGAGMRMADSFEVRTYGGPSINSRKKFGGLDSFRDQMLSGQSALNMQSEELPPPPPPMVNLDDEQAAMQAVLAATLEAEDVNSEINSLTGEIEQSVERIPEAPSKERPVDVELEIPDDDAVISVLDDADDHSDEREYPPAPATRKVTLGSGKHQGTLTDRLAELEEYRRRDAERAAAEEVYDDRYDARYYDEYDEGYDEYADEYEEYEDDYDYEEYDEYDDEYDDYDDGYDDYDDDYDDEYDDEYDEYEDEEDEYDDYYDDDDDDGYYEE